MLSVPAARLWQQLLSPCPATRVLSQPHTPFPVLGDSRVALGVPVLLGVTLQEEPVTASMGAFAALPSLGKTVSLCPPDPPYPLSNTGQDNRPHVLCVLQGGPADRQGEDSSAAPSASLSGVRHTALGQHCCWEGCGTRGSPVAPGGPHTSSVVPAWGTLWGTRPQGRAALKC